MKRISAIVTLVVLSSFLQLNAQQISNKKFIDTANMDLSIRPGDNFYLYANGNWLRNTSIPASKTSWGSFAVLNEESSLALKSLLEEAALNPGNSAVMKKVGNFYKTAMDSLTIEELGYQPIQQFLEGIGRLQTREDLMRGMNYLRSGSITSPLYRVSVAQDAREVTRYRIHIGQGGTSLPDRDYYLKDDSRSLAIRKEFLNYMSTLFALTGADATTALAKANAVLQLETKIARAQLSRVQMRDPLKLYNKFSIGALNEKTPGINWHTTLPDLGFRTVQDSVIVSNPAFIVFADSLLQTERIEDLKTYLQWNILRDWATHLSRPFVNANFAFNKVLSGQKAQTPRWQRMSNLVDGQLGELLGQLYVDKYFKPEAKKRMMVLIRNMTETFESRIKKLDWMSEETKKRALAKLYTFVSKIGYPDKWKDYDKLEMIDKDYFGNLLRAIQWRYQEQANKLGQPINKTEWLLTAPTVNAYYNSVQNEIVFPAGILRFPFFDFEADDAINYGGIAAVIGHEMTHGFDDQGRQYDATGNLQDWWTRADAAEFNKRADKLVEQYNAYTVLDTLHVNGKLTLGENLADLGGLSIAYEAFKKTPQGRSNKKINGFTPDQRFFLNWAQIWRITMLPEAAAQRILTDTHSPGMYRANGPVMNMDAFYKAFDIKEGDKMFKAKDQRITVW